MKKKKGPQLAFKVVSVVRTDDGRTLYTSIHPSFRRIYEVGIFYTDGPFLLFADLDSAQKVRAEPHSWSSAPRNPASPVHSN